MDLRNWNYFNSQVLRNGFETIDKLRLTDLLAADKKNKLLIYADSDEGTKFNQATIYGCSSGKNGGAAINDLLDSVGGGMLEFNKDRYVFSLSVTRNPQRLFSALEVLRQKITLVDWAGTHRILHIPYWDRSIKTAPDWVRKFMF